MHFTSSDIYRYFLFSVFFFCAGMHWVLKSVIMIQGYSFAFDIFLPQCHFKKSCFGLSKGAWTRADTLIEM